MKLRIPLPKQCPKVFKNKKKYNRKKNKEEVKKDIKEVFNKSN